MNRPVPTRLRIVRGNPGKRPLPENEPKPPAGAEVPAGLSKKAKVQWARVSEMLERAGVLSEIDADALASFCEQYAVWREALDTLHGPKSKGGGLVTKTALGFYVQSPYLTIANKAQDRMVALLREFGMTPSSRTRVSVINQKPKKNRFAEIKGGAA